jgi:hypothetical protein
MGGSSILCQKVRNYYRAEACFGGGSAYAEVSTGRVAGVQLPASTGFEKGAAKRETCAPSLEDCAALLGTTDP